MNSTKLVVGFLLVVVFVGGYMVGDSAQGIKDRVRAFMQDPVPEVTEVPVGDTASAASGTALGVAVESGSLTDDQKKLIRALGIDPDSITITPQMVVCAESSLGAERIRQIRDGATPSFTEGVKLSACYR